MIRFGILTLSTVAAALSATAALASDLEVPPSTLVLPIYPPQVDQGFVLSVPSDDSAPLTGDLPVLAPARGDEPLSFTLFTEPAPPPPPPETEVVAAIAPAAAVPPVPRAQPSPVVRSTARATPPAAVAPRRQPQQRATPARSPEPTRRIQPGWLLGVYR
jgi:hypothetical protein